MNYELPSLRMTPLRFSALIHVSLHEIGRDTVHQAALDSVKREIGLGLKNKLNKDADRNAQANRDVFVAHDGKGTLTIATGDGAHVDKTISIFYELFQALSWHFPLDRIPRQIMVEPYGKAFGSWREVVHPQYGRVVEVIKPALVTDSVDTPEASIYDYNEHNPHRSAAFYTPAGTQQLPTVNPRLPYDQTELAAVINRHQLSAATFEID